MVNGKAVYVKVEEENGFRMTADLIEPHITDRTKLLIVNSPSNPTGGILEYEELEKIAQLVRQHKIFVIADEPYERFVYDNKKHISLATFEGLEDYILTINSFSKTYAMTGWRVGYICANERIMSNLVKLHENMIASVNEAFQLAAVSALKNGENDVKNMFEAYRKNRDYLIHNINRIKGFSCIPPEGAFYAFPNIRDFGMSSRDAANMIFEKTHIATAPGSAFGYGGEGFLRICYVSDFTKIEEAVYRLKNVFGEK